MTIQSKVKALKGKLESEIKSLESQAQAVTTNEAYNTIQTLIQEKENVVYRLANVLDKNLS